MNYTYLCAYHTILCAYQLLPALFNYRLYCHLDIEKGLAMRWPTPFCVLSGYLYAGIFSMTRR